MPKPVVVEGIGEPIARRTFTFGHEDVMVTIGKPRPFDPEGHEGYYCPYSIEFRGSKKYRYSGGIDAVQAFQLVMKGISSDLETIGMKNGGLATWWNVHNI